MTIICMVRHGQTDWNIEKRLQGREEIPLNEKGKKEARECGSCLSHKKWDILVSSPLGRAVESAQIIGRELKIDKINIEEDFIERDYGIVSGMNYMERNKKYPDKNYPECEELIIFRDRILRGMEKIAKDNPNKNIVIVSHGGVINGVLSILSDGEIGTGKTVLKNGGINLFRYDQGKWEIIGYNKLPGELNCCDDL